MIVAIYAEGISKVLPVNPVGRIERLAPRGRRQERSRQEQSSSFEAILASMMQAADPEDAPVFDTYA